MSDYTEYINKVKTWFQSGIETGLKLKNLPVTTFVMIFAFALIVITILYYLYYTGTLFTDGLKERQCNAMERKYSDLNGKIHAVVVNSNLKTESLKNFYIKTAYNCCSVGEYKNDYVDLCSLKNVLKQGVRGLDFEIFSIKNKPVIATSVSENYHVKETFNFIPFEEAMKIIENYAFSASTAPNPNDPIIIHLRVKSSNSTMYKNLVRIFKNYESILLGNEFSFSNHGKNIGDTEISKFANKVVVLCDREIEELSEYVNGVSNSRYIRCLHASDIEYMQDNSELARFNKKGITIAMPDKGSDPGNPNSIVMRDNGCQLLAMRYQLVDVHLQENEDFFNSKGFAFVLKK